MRWLGSRSGDRARWVARCAPSLAVVVLALALAAPTARAQTTCTPSASNPVVRFTTTLGDVDVVLCTVDAPETVDNFLQYVDDGAYTDTGFIHRSVQGGIFVLQGGGAWIDAGGVMRLVETREPTPFEVDAGLSNVRGTIAMARTSELDSATSQWFFNVQDNPSLDPVFDPQDPTTPVDGYAVFGEVIAGLGVLDDIASQTIWALNPGFLVEVPLVSYPDDGSSVTPYLVYVTDVRVVPEPGAALQAVAGLLGIALLAQRRRRALARRRDTP